MQDIYLIETLEQLRCISDPLRIEIIHLIGEKPLTSQMIGEKLNIPRSKIHYHLKELEKHGFVKIAKTEQVRNFIQIYYEPISKAIMTSPEILSRTFDATKNMMEYFPVEIDKNLESAFTTSIKQVCKEFQEKSTSNTKQKYHLSIIKIDR